MDLLNGLDSSSIKSLLEQNTKNIVKSPNNEEYIQLQKVLISALMNNKKDLVEAIISGLSGELYTSVYDSSIEFEQGNKTLEHLFSDEVVKEILEEEDNQVFNIEDFLVSLETEIEDMEEDSSKKDSMLYLASAIKGYLMFN